MHINPGAIMKKKEKERKRKNLGNSKSDRSAL